MEGGVRRISAGVIPWLLRWKWHIMAASPVIAVFFFRFVVATWVLDQCAIAIRTLWTSPVPEAQWADPNFWTACFLSSGLSECAF